MIDFSLSEEQLAFQKTARDFARKEIKPHSAMWDQMADPIGRCPWDVMEKAVDAGLTKIIVPEEHGGLGMGVLDLVVVLEEIAAVDQGFAAMLLLSNVNRSMLLRDGTPEQVAKWSRWFQSKKLFVFASGVVEPNRGGSEAMCPIPDPNLGLQTVARREGENYIINGSKGAFCTNNGPRADALIVLARTDLSKPPQESTAAFLIPADTPGVSYGPQTEKIGWRNVNHAQIFLDDVVVPVDARIGGENAAFAQSFPQTFATICATVGILAVGTARAALEYAVEYAKQRVTWGQPIINHQAVAFQLADMEMKLCAARHLARHAAWMADNHPGEMHSKGAIAKAFCTEAAIEICLKAQGVLGMYGLSKDYPIEKYLRDTLSGPIQDGHNNMWRLHIAGVLAATDFS